MSEKEDQAPADVAVPQSTTTATTPGRDSQPENSVGRATEPDKPNGIEKINSASSVR